MIRRQELGLSVPDFKQATDTYFLDWMRFGLQEFDEYSRKGSRLSIFTDFNGTCDRRSPAPRPSGPDPDA